MSGVSHGQESGRSVGQSGVIGQSVAWCRQSVSQVRSVSQSGVSQSVSQDQSVSPSGRSVSQVRSVTESGQSVVHSLTQSGQISQSVRKVGESVVISQ